MFWYLSGLDHINAKPDGSGFEKLEGKRADAWRQRLNIVRVRHLRRHDGRRVRRNER